MFRRTKTVTVTPEPVETKPGGKGRPTPSRKEAEAAARARAKAAPRTRKEMARAQRASRAESSQKVRQAMKTGDERYFMPRDKGPVRRFVRDFVDSRFSFIELMIPLLIFSMILGYSGNAAMANLSSLVLMATIVLIVLDMVFLRLRLRRELAARFPNESHKGTTYYAITRALQMKFMRLPKAQVKIGQRLPDHYR
ncbi:DUF3043 domain-containing protein [Nocardioides sp. zg-DK7169]|uniref:DUF3043 domain-containing protein n=1 Tax=Nocardioides sp. zg-DK7169 TaxID=2736600 RepID=UPI001552D800|nr:DUF3043 domain-containing protein [Nocardioides sp. zg-DK7169]NPC95482.1 DUF3043 domain-containing protein [Nocardioides sp. zg-DK7169]